MAGAGFVECQDWVVVSRINTATSLLYNSGKITVITVITVITIKISPRKITFSLLAKAKISGRNSCLCSA